MSLINIANGDDIYGIVRSVRIEAPHYGLSVILDASATIDTVRSTMLDRAFGAATVTDARFVADTVWGLLGSSRTLYGAQRVLNQANTELSQTGIDLQIELAPEEGRLFLVRSTWREN